MFEELFSRKRQTKTSERKLEEVEAIRRVKGGAKRSRHSSMTVDQYTWLLRLTVGCVVVLGLVIIGSAAYGLISDFVTYSAGAPVDSSSVQPPAGELGE